jgi:hypothetical protein
MAVLTRVTDFIPNTLIKSQEVDDEFNQLVNLLSGVSTNKDTLLKFSDATNPVLRVDQLGAGPIQRWLQNGVQKALVNNDGSFNIGTPGASPTAGKVAGPDASGTNIAGADLNLAGGRGTGNAQPGLPGFKYPLTTSSGSAIQGLSSDLLPPRVNMHVHGGTTTTVSNTTTETSILAASEHGSTKTIEAGMARLGRTYLLRLIGQVITTGTPTLRIRLKLGSVLLADTTAITMANNTNSSGGGFVIEALVTITAVGPSGATLNTLTADYAVSAGGAVNRLPAAGGATVDFTASQTFDVTVQWSAADASNVVVILASLIDMDR